MVVTRLADILVIQAIRSWLDENSLAQVGWLGALKDKQVGRALALIHKRPEREWSLASLAREVGMSRSGFAKRFATLVGMPTMQYIARCRMRLAHQHLQQRAFGVSELASKVGYQSEAAFSRAFKRYIGISPSHPRSGLGVRG